MGQINYEFGAIEAGAGEIHAAVGRTAGLLDEGQGSLARLQSAWVGDGSMSYQAVQQRWDANSSRTSPINPYPRAPFVPQRGKQR